MHAYCLDWCATKLQPGAKVLDVGCGSGYLCAAYYEMVKNNEGKAHVIGIDHITDLTMFSVKNLNKNYSNQLSDGSIRIVCGDGRQGWTEGAPYDIIHVGAAAPQVPEVLLK